MKKFIAITSIVSTFVASSALAKTEGNFVELDILQAHSSNKYQINEKDTDTAKFKDSSLGFGVSYKHAFNLDKIFIAPGVFFDQLGTKARESVDSVTAQYRYGAKLDIGYDFTEKFAAYLTNGISNVKYKINWNSVNGAESDSKLGYFIGFGSSYKVAKDVSVNLEYNMQSLLLDTPDRTGAVKLRSNIGVLKLGVSYNF
jgi:opacity protein-like surface antigen